MSSSACEQLPRFLGVKDPDNQVILTFKGRVPAGVTITSVTVVEVDASDTPVVASEFTFGTVTAYPVDGLFWKAQCTCDGGSANPVVTPGVRPEPKQYFVRSRWFRSDGTTRDRTLRLYVGHN